MSRYRKFAGLATLALAVITSTPARPRAAAASAPATATVEVSIDNFSFAPSTLSVTAGTTVTWTNRDDVPHTVVSNDKLFASRVLDTDEKFSYTFKDPGTYGYYCSIHPKMTAKVVVK